jgi:hypothetical protein
LAVGDDPVSVVAPGELPDSVPAIRMPVSLIVPLVAIRVTWPAPPSVTSPGIVMLAPVKDTALAVTVPAMVSSALSVIEALGPPATTPVTLSDSPSFSANPAALNDASVAIWLTVPASKRLVAPVECPDKVPAINVPGSLIVPPVAISETVPAPPSLTRPEMVRLAPLRLTAVALTAPLIDKLPLSRIVALAPPLTTPVTARPMPSSSVKPAAVNEPSVATWLVVVEVPVIVVAPPEPPDSVPAISVPVSLMAPLLVIRLTVPPPPSVTRPGIEIAVPLRLTAVALTVPPIVSDALSAIVAVAPPLTVPLTFSVAPSFSVNAVPVTLPRVRIWLAAGVEPVSVIAPVALPDGGPAVSVPAI